MQLGVKLRRIVSVLLCRCICWVCGFSRSKFGNIESAGKFIDKNWETLNCFFPINLFSPPFLLSPSLFRLIIFQKLLQQLTHFFWSIQMMKWCKEIWPTIRAYLMLRSILKTWRQSLMRYAFCSVWSFGTVLLLLLLCEIQGSRLLVCSQFLLSFPSCCLPPSSLFCLLDAFSNSHLSCFSLFHKSQEITDSGIPERYYMRITIGAKQVQQVIQMHECCSSTA